MLDAGLRVSEACTLRLGDFDFKNRILKVKSLKKRSKDIKTRLVPLSNRLYQALAPQSQLQSGKDGYQFPRKNKTKLLTSISQRNFLPSVETRKFRTSKKTQTKESTPF